MEITFDIGKDELPLFLAEVDEHLQVLDNNLLRLQKESADVEIIQTVFRSAHTIKGMAGMIGHRRMTSITHVLENALDGVRKNSLSVSPKLINLCLDAVDCLRSLREEVSTSVVSDVDVEGIVSSFKSLIERGNVECLVAKKQLTAKDENNSTLGDALDVLARIDTNSMASAARAFQLMMVLQDLGDIKRMSPSQEEIEAASSVGEFSAALITDQSFEKVSAALTRISGVDEISINGKIIVTDGNPVLGLGTTMGPGPQPKVQAGEAVPGQPSRERRNTDPNGRRVSDLTLRMSIEHMDNLMNLVGELITDRNHLQQIRSHISSETSLNGNIDKFFETITHLGRITDQLQEEVMSIRMLPIGNLFNRFPRMVHDMCQKVGKTVEMVLHGEDTEMDRSMIDTIYDPLIHLIRNSVDHGIELPQERIAAGKPETGIITLTARHEQGRIVVIVEDELMWISCEIRLF
jgi:two-component system chemotaxis sensor kinase CheA